MCYSNTQITTRYSRYASYSAQPYHKHSNFLSATDRVIIVAFCAELVLQKSDINWGVKHME